jgi:hypothetical protein
MGWQLAPNERAPLRRGVEWIFATQKPTIFAGR